MDYKDFKTEQDLVNALEKGIVVTGGFLCDYIPQTLSDYTYRGVIFRNSIIVQGSFVSCAFLDCTFENVVFRTSDFTGTNFSRCRFKDCVFSDVDSGFLIDEGSVVDGLTVCNDSEENMKYYIDTMNERNVPNN